MLDALTDSEFRHVGLDVVKEVGSNDHPAGVGLLE
jgi:hypothetical protein